MKGETVNLIGVGRRNHEAQSNDQIGAAIWLWTFLSTVFNKDGERTAPTCS